MRDVQHMFVESKKEESRRSGSRMLQSTSVKPIATRTEMAGQWRITPDDAGTTLRLNSAREQGRKAVKKERKILSERYHKYISINKLTTLSVY
jgi:hypothetical protein